MQIIGMVLYRQSEFNNFYYLCSVQDDQSHILLAPMPGVVKKIQCHEGDSVAEGAIIVTLEAMKMQNPLFAPKTGIVSKYI